MWIFYETLLLIGLLLYVPRALWRKRLPHRGWTMRLGRYPRSVSTTLHGRRPIWIHAVSVGEVLAVQPLLHALTSAAPREPLVLSTITSSGFEVAEKQLGERGVAIYFPLDFRVCVTHALDALHPRLLILVESELWPTMIRLANARGIPIAIVNGRISPRAFRRYRWVAPWVGSLLRQIDRFLMQGQPDADRIIQLGAPPAKVQVMGSLKWDASLGARPTSQTIQETAVRLGLNGQEIVLVAGSTHRGEEAALLDAFQTVRTSHPHARLIIAPRHLERLAEVEGLVRQAGLTSARLSHLPAATGAAQTGAAGGAGWDVGLVDTLGQLPRYYGLATVAFVGGSLIPHGGQNPIEAASLGKPILFGPFMHNFTEIAHQLTSHLAARQITDIQGLTPALQALLTHRAEAQAMGRRAQELTERSQGVVQRTVEALAPLLANTS